MGGHHGLAMTIGRVIVVLPSPRASIHANAMVDVKSSWRSRRGLGKPRNNLTSPARKYGRDRGMGGGTGPVVVLVGTVDAGVIGPRLTSFEKLAI